MVDDSGGTSVAQGADFVVVVAGLTPEDEGEDYTILSCPGIPDRDQSLALDGKHGGTTQNNYIKSIAALGKPMVVVLEGGSVIDVSSFGSSVPALVMMAFGTPDNRVARRSGSCCSARPISAANCR